jgi:hypothetical protein
MRIELARARNEERGTYHCQEAGGPPHADNRSRFLVPSKSSVPSGRERPSGKVSNAGNTSARSAPIVVVSGAPPRALTRAMPSGNTSKETKRGAVVPARLGHDAHCGVTWWPSTASPQGRDQW